MMWTQVWLRHSQLPYIFKIPVTQFLCVIKLIQDHFHFGLFISISVFDSSLVYHNNIIEILSPQGEQALMYEIK